MSLHALAIVLFAAVLHASWNALVKASGDRALNLAGVALTHAACGLLFLFLAGFDTVVYWPLLALSAAIHFVYYALLFHAYRLGDLSQVYPIARGMSPSLSALGAYLLIGERLHPLALMGVALITVGIALLAFQKRTEHTDRHAIWVAVLLGICIAAYSTSDSIGVRWSHNTLGYVGWLYLLEAPVVIFILAQRWRSAAPFDWKPFGIGLVGGLAATIAYALALYVSTFAPIGAVSAVRESSVIIAALIGVFAFGERPVGYRLIAAGVVAAGVILLAAGG